MSAVRKKPEQYIGQDSRSAHAGESDEADSWQPGIDAPFVGHASADSRYNPLFRQMDKMIIAFSAFVRVGRSLVLRRKDERSNEHQDDSDYHQSDNCPHRENSLMLENFDLKQLFGKFLFRLAIVAHLFGLVNG
jgi:hypothetical protein